MPEVVKEPSVIHRLMRGSIVRYERSAQNGGEQTGINRCMIRRRDDQEVAAGGHHVHQCSR
eukprot:scaffold462101_cov29-Prasinocladus_malaysianus.AAC.1